MISYDRDPQQTIPESSVKIIGLGGAGSNMLDRAALDGMTGAEMLCVNTDMRTLTSSVATDKIQIGKNLTKGLGAGGDPELGNRAAQESELEIRDALRGRKMVFLCVGLGGGTGSGAAPLITRFAREEGAFVVVFATMPFEFEGKRRREQAEAALNELAALSNALVIFDNGRMGELVLAKQGIHEAFAAADRMITESIKAVTRLVVRPGLINVGLDDLMTALRSTRSRCLFGSGIADGENRTQQALENALASPLLEKGSLLEDATSVLVHICGGESLTLYEVELLMQSLSKYVADSAQVLFGVASDPAMGDSVSVTLISSLPEDKLTRTAPVRSAAVAGSVGKADDQVRDEKAVLPSGDDEETGHASLDSASSTIEIAEDEQIMEPSEGFTSKDDVLAGLDDADDEMYDEVPEPDVIEQSEDVAEPEASEPEVAVDLQEPEELPEHREQEEPDNDDEITSDHVKPERDTSDFDAVPDFSKFERISKEDEAGEEAREEEKREQEEQEEAPEEKDEEDEEDEEEDAVFFRAEDDVPFAETQVDDEAAEGADDSGDNAKEKSSFFKRPIRRPKKASQGELELDGGAKGKFEGESPNIHEGEDLDIPPFLRKKRR